ncbi:BZ3500_MvSof-1268-A1-R1_Chr1-3g01585 [Microbotryum saponariae]|uniref:BZ3500_MvSof-1268-A1-R1_Chr1-3g01585 protein n=1 Tax=Microbotryum saponariae TaxID=289078 RepID=A0A2X0M6A3_9BASI|nr:BZ3500_MvSof-1268-A1-R1_Chr1-3g01585 [Microbotryum saponariae]SCZ94093.1 BZ3501_MvSof-1269-A2-R1_Chr1-3g01187 [Microbotryum saponariae]
MTSARGASPKGYHSAALWTSPRRAGSISSSSKASNSDTSSAKAPGPRKVYMSRSFTSYIRYSLLTFALLMALLILSDSPSLFGLRLGRRVFVPSKRFHRLGAGHWLPLPQPFTHSDTQEEYGARAFDPAFPNRVEEIGLSVAGWRWIPKLRSRKGMREWNAYLFVKRLLNSEHGLIIVGDEASQQMMTALGGLVDPEDAQTHHSKIDWGGLLRVARGGYYVDPKSKGAPFRYTSIPNETAEITIWRSTWLKRLRRDLPHVPDSRFEAPVVRFVRHDTLVNMTRITELAKAMRLSPVFLKEGTSKRLRQTNWRSLLHPLSTDPTWRGQQNSVLLFNSGSHWKSDEFGLNAQDLLDVSQAMIRDLLSELVELPRFDIIGRSTPLAAPGCAYHVAPLDSAPPRASDSDFLNRVWQPLDLQNSWWAAEMDTVARKGRTRDSSGSLVYMNVTEMAGQRPDARVVGASDRPDCLHWTLPGVPSVWLRMLWHIISGVDNRTGS